MRLQQMYYNKDTYILMLEMIKSIYEAELYTFDERIPSHIISKKIYDNLDEFIIRLQKTDDINVFRQIHLSVAYMFQHDNKNRKVLKKICDADNYKYWIIRLYNSENKESVRIDNMYNAEEYNAIKDRHPNIDNLFKILYDDIKEFDHQNLNCNLLDARRYSSRKYNLFSTLVGIFGLSILSVGSYSFFDKNSFFKGQNQFFYNSILILGGAFIFLFSFYLLYKKEYESIKNLMIEFENAVFKRVDIPLNNPQEVSV